MNPERRGIGESDFEFTGSWYRLDPIWEYCQYDTWEDHFVVCRHRFDWRKGLLYRCPIETWWAMSWDEREEDVLGFVRRSESQPQSSDERAAALDPGWKKTYPALWEHMTRGTYDDGARRVLSTLSWFLGLEGLTICLQDRDNKRSLFASGATWIVALDVLEELAQRGDEAPWRADKRETGGSARLKGK